MPKYQKKPTIVDAEIWQPGKRLPNVLIDGDNGFPGSKTIPVPDESNTGATITVKYPKDHGFIHVNGVENVMGTPGLDVHPGWWVIQLHDGTAFTCDPETFEKIYEPVLYPPLLELDAKTGGVSMVRCPRCRTSFHR